MSPRRAPSNALKLESLFLRGMVLCVLCGERIGTPSECEWHHVHERELGGPDTADNIGPAHAEPCHRKATARFARDRAHITRIQKKAAGTWKRRGPKIQSPGFDKSRRRLFSGKVERVSP